MGKAVSIFFFHLVCSCNSWFTPPFDQSVVAEIGRHWHKGHSIRTEPNSGFPISVAMHIVAEDMLRRHIIEVGYAQYIQPKEWPAYKSKLEAPIHTKWNTNSFWENQYNENDDLADTMKYAFKKGRDKW